MKRGIRLGIVSAFQLWMLLIPRVASAQVAFEVATIKPQDPRTLRLVGGSCHGIDSNYPPNAAIVPPLGRCLITWNLPALLNIAYSVVAPTGGISQITGGPNWMNSDFWFVEAKAENTATAKEAELKQMLQTLLTERFKLKFHHESKEVPGFALVVGKGGLKITEDHGEKGNEPPMSAGPSGLAYHKAPLSMFANYLSGPAGGPVVDKTGLTGLFTFDFRLQDPANPDPNAPSIFTRVQEELGLRLESTKLPADVIVIDSAERPSSN